MPKGSVSEPGFRRAPLPVAPLGAGERLACLRLIRTEGIGPVTFRDLVNHCGGAERALERLPELSRRGGRRRPLQVYARAAAEAELEAARRIGAEPVFTIEPGYPAALAHVAVPPPLLYVKGRRALLGAPSVAIVGSRNASAAGQAFARRLAAGVGARGLVVISGLARGIDGVAHEAALETGTIAVLAGGVDHVYPPEHEALQAKIAEEGCLVSEQPPGFRPRGQDFPRRNRIISGIALGVVIVEAARRSGSLITARMAAEQGREVFAVPGHPLDPRAEGTNLLLKGGATIATSAEDILEVLAPQLAGTSLGGAGDRTVFDDGLTGREPDSGSGAPEPLGDGGAEALLRIVVGALGPAPVSTDALTRATGLAPRQVSGALLELSLADRIEWHGSQLVSLKPAGD